MGAVLATVGPAPAVHAAATAHPSSVPFRFQKTSDEQFSGSGCGATVSVDVRLPAGATRPRVVEPRVGDRDGETPTTRVTVAEVRGTLVHVEVVADGAGVCAGGAEPVAWDVTYRVRATYTRRVRPTIRTFYESSVFGAKWATRPRTIQDSRAGTPRSVRSRFVGLRWSSFGGRVAKATGTQHLDYCRAGDACPDQDAPVRLVASKPGFCTASGRIEYLQLAVYVRGRLDSVSPLRCG